MHLPGRDLLGGQEVGCEIDLRRTNVVATDFPQTMVDEPSYLISVVHFYSYIQTPKRTRE